MAGENFGGVDRRRLFGLAGAGWASLALGAPSALAATDAGSLGRPRAGQIATDPVFWGAVRNLYRVSPDMVNLENGYWGVMAEPVRLEFESLNAMINRDNTIYARTHFGRDIEAVRTKVAALVGADVSEIVMTRGATEALQALIGGYGRLKAGDAVMYADLDYDSMQYAMNWLKERRGVDVVRFDMPEPATRQAVLDAYAQALAANPKVRLLLLTHISHRTGLLLPVAEIARMARARGVDVIVDAAHSIGQIDFKVADLQADFVGFNLHKWIGAPIGAGFAYIRKERLGDVERFMADEDSPANDIRSRIHTGTYNFAAMLAVPKAIALHEQIGVAAKAARLRHLRDYWVSRARAMGGIEILTPDEPGMSGALTSFRLAGKGTKADNDAIVATLRDRFKVLTVRRGGVAKGHCIRVTPALFTSEADLDRFIDALGVVSGNKPGQA
jgi:selenocysteine lyase/cysteine desulfurase